jgi:hypothetical protein
MGIMLGFPIGPPRRMVTRGCGRETNLSPRLPDGGRLPHCEPNVLGDAPQQGGRDVTAKVEGYRGASSVRVAELLVGSLLPNLDKPEPFEQCHDRARPQNRDVTHGYAAMVMV